MCLGIPARIVSLGDDCQAEAEIGGVIREVDLTLVPQAKVGDYVLIHVGYAIERIDEAEAMQTVALIKQMVEAADEGSK